MTSFDSILDSLGDKIMIISRLLATPIEQKRLSNAYWSIIHAIQSIISNETNQPIKWLLFTVDLKSNRCRAQSTTGSIEEKFASKNKGVIRAGGTDWTKFEPYIINIYHFLEFIKENVIWNYSWIVRRTKVSDSDL